VYRLLKCRSPHKSLRTQCETTRLVVSLSAERPKDFRKALSRHPPVGVQCRPHFPNVGYHAVSAIILSFLLLSAVNYVIFYVYFQ
jgi:hypothetical protein